jgi:hypothetical protein
MGGGIFELSFSPTVDLFRDVDFDSVDMDLVYGNGLQYISAKSVSVDPVATPEPVGFVLLATCTLIALAARWRKTRTR